MGEQARFPHFPAIRDRLSHLWPFLPFKMNLLSGWPSERCFIGRAFRQIRFLTHWQTAWPRVRSE